MEYKGFVTQPQFMIDLGLYVAEIIHGCNVIAFSAENLQQLKEVMIAAIDNYLQDRLEAETFIGIHEHLKELA